jgi:hypothetical protein
MTDHLIGTIDNLLQNADECEMLGGLAATHDQRVAYREQAERLRILASDAHRAQVLLDAIAHRFLGEEQTCQADHCSRHDAATQ